MYTLLLPWHTNKILIIGLQCLTRRRFAAICAPGKSYIPAGKPGEPGKSRQIEAMDGSQMVVEIQKVYYRAKFSGHRLSETAFESLPYRKRIFHNFKEAWRAEKLPGSVQYSHQGMTIKFRITCASSAFQIGFSFLYYQVSVCLQTVGRLFFLICIPSELDHPLL